MAFTAADVKKLRDETDAPMMECKTALTEANGDFTKAKEILREKGKAAAAKRADRVTKAGVVAIALSGDNKAVGAVIIECETDFVAKNPDFIAVANEIAKALTATDPGNDPLAVKVGSETIGSMIEGAIAKIRENIKVTRAVRKTTTGAFASYVHHDNTKGSIIELSGDASTLLEAGHKLAIQSVAFPPSFIRKDEIPADLIAKELEIETQRAINEGKNAEVAKNIAQGRINKEYYKAVVLLEQPFYADLAKNVGTYISEQAKAGNGSIDVKGFTLFAVGEAESE
jgi:elongation factor Ts